MDIDVDHEMYLKFEEYRYNAQAEGANPMDYHAWKQTPIARGYLERLEAQAQVAPLDGPAAADVRDTLVRGDLFNRVQEVLDLAAYYLPGELGEFPDKVQKTVADFKNYRNLAEKQIQERDEQLATLQALYDETVDQVIAHRGTLQTILAWLEKWDGFGVEDGFTNEAMLVMVKRDLEASYKLPMQVVDTRAERAAREASE